MPDDPGDSDGASDPRENSEPPSELPLAATRRTSDPDLPSALFTTGGTTDDHVALIRAELAARGVPKSEAALEAILVLDAEVLSRTEFEIALETALDRGVIERTESGLVPNED